MAARPEDAKAEIAELRHAKGSELEALLEEERKAWRDGIHWDFAPSADLIRRYVDMRALTGFVLRVNRRVVGYTYHVVEETKTLIGNLFVLPPLATPEAEHRLLQATLAEAFDHGHGRRVEAQLMMLRHQPEHGRLSRRFPGLVGRSFARYFMLAPLADGGVAPVPDGMSIELWDERYADAGARLITAAYEGHIDSEINDQYLTAVGARRFLSNIVLYPGCGAFQGSASFAAVDRSGNICGLSLASVVAPGTGHITQICVAPWAQGRGVGGALLGRSLEKLRQAGCLEASLTVTAANSSAVRLYRRFQFGVLREFCAHVWEWPIPRA
jgi:ribosomal protein S18 acetylase RimI-like enzyme